MIKVIQVRNIDDFVRTVLPKKPEQNKKIVESILNDVRKRGDAALRYYEKKFSGTHLKQFQVSKDEVIRAYSKITTKQIEAIKTSKKRLSKTESELKRRLKNFFVKLDGIKIQKTFIPIASTGCYIPGGLAKYPSSVIMSVIPAKIAGVKRVIVSSPPNKDGTIDPLTLVTADICGVDEFYKVGGAQAIAAMSFGTKSILPVDKIVGPGGTFVTTAKSLVSNNTSIDMLAGPTELGIVADDSASPNLIAIDLISQSEHSPDTFCFMITDSAKLAKTVQLLLKEKITNSQRKKIIKQSLQNNGFIAICKNKTDIINLANNLAPEHLEILTKNPQIYASKITTPGVILIGSNTPSAVSDYLLGSNHILPTNRFGRIRGSLSVLDFMKLHTKVESSRTALLKISKYMEIFTSGENLPNHLEALRSRIS